MLQESQGEENMTSQIVTVYNAHSSRLKFCIIVDDLHLSKKS